METFQRLFWLEGASPTNGFKNDVWLLDYNDTPNEQIQWLFLIPDDDDEKGHEAEMNFE